MLICLIHFLPALAGSFAGTGFFDTHRAKTTTTALESLVTQYHTQRHRDYRDSEKNKCGDKYLHFALLY